MSLSLSDVLARLKGVSRSGDEHKAKCPAHADDRASLTIKLGTDGRVLLYCHAGCDYPTIREALGLKRAPSPGGRREVATYPYRDESGSLLYEVVRFAPKDFRPRRPDGAWSLRGVRRIPYRLPQLRTACKDGRVVFVVEGEKDADALAHVKLCGTTVAGGCKGTWPDDLPSYFRGAARVVILPDNDAPGREFGVRVAYALHAAGLPVHLVALPGLSEKGDVSDWLGDGGTREELTALAKAAPRWSPDEERPKPEATGAVAQEVRAVREEEDDEGAGGSTTTRPTLQVEALHGILGDYVRLVEPYTEAHPAGILFSLLACVGCWIGRSPYQVLDGSRHYLNLFVLLVGSTGAGRKGTAWAQACSLLRNADPSFATERIRGGLSTGEGLIDFLAPPSAPPNGETEAVTDTRVVMSESEFGAVLARKGREGNTLSAILRQAWDGQALANLTARKPGQSARVVQEPHVSLVGHITASELRELVTNQDVRNGFLNRFALVHVERVRLLPDGGSPSGEAVTELASDLLRRVSGARRRAEVPLSSEAREAWGPLYEFLSFSTEGDIAARGAPIVRRIALLFALLDGSRAVDVSHLVAARACWAFCEESARFVLGPAGGLNELARRFYAAAQNSGADGITRSGLWDAGGSRNRAQSAVDTAIQALVDAGLVMARRVTGPNGGRPATRYFDARLLLRDVGNMGRMGNIPPPSFT